jgi:hypothetical protein
MFGDHFQTTMFMPGGFLFGGLFSGTADSYKAATKPNEINRSEIAHVDGLTPRLSSSFHDVKRAPRFRPSAVNVAFDDRSATGYRDTSYWQKVPGRVGKSWEYSLAASGPRLYHNWGWVERHARAHRLSISGSWFGCRTGCPKGFLGSEKRVDRPLLEEICRQLLRTDQNSSSWRRHFVSHPLGNALATTARFFSKLNAQKVGARDGNMTEIRELRLRCTECDGTAFEGTIFSAQDQVDAFLAVLSKRGGRPGF